MNEHRRMFKANNYFQWIQILLCIVLTVPRCGAKILYDEAKFSIFQKEPTNFESEILKSLQTTTNFFAKPDVRNAVIAGIGIGIIYPPLAEVTGIIFVLNSLLAHESDWKASFSAAIAHETGGAIALYGLQSMEAAMRTIGKQYYLLTDNSSDIYDRKTVAFFIHSNVDKMLNIFDKSDSLFKKYPLLATPILIQLAQLIAFFDPLGKSILKKGSMDEELPCLMHNILLDYRHRAVNDRIEKLRSDSKFVPEILSFALEGTYNRYGYSIGIPPSFNCERCSDKSKSCLSDDFGDSYEIKRDRSFSCVRDYALFVRHRVEELYSDELIDTLNNLCSKKPETTGSGWLTIKLKHLRARLYEDDGQLCDPFSLCDSYIKLYIDGKLKLETVPRINTISYDVGAIYTSPKTTKDAIIKIEVWDHNDVFEDEILLKREGNVDSFLKDGHIKVVINPEAKNIHYEQNHLSTITFWQDEYKY